MRFNRMLIILGGVLAIIIVLVTVTYETERAGMTRKWYRSTYQFVDGHMLYRDVSDWSCMGTNSDTQYTLLFRDDDTIYLTDELFTDKPCLSTYYVKDDGTMIPIANAQEEGVLSTESLLEHDFKVDITEAYNFTPENASVDSIRQITIDGSDIDLGEKYEPDDENYNTLMFHIVHRPYWNETPDSSDFVNSLRVTFSNGERRIFERYSDYIIDKDTGYVAYFDVQFDK